MLNLLSKGVFSELNLSEVFLKIKEIYGINDISDERKEYLAETIKKYGYLPYPQFKALEELSDGEVIFSLIKIFELEGTSDGERLLNFYNPSVLSRKKIKDSNWFKKEGHNIKLMSLSALGDGEKTKDTGKFIEWVCELITLPRGNSKLGILPDTIYLIPFHPREFGCAYLPMSSDVSPNLEDSKLRKFLGMDAKEQVKMFIALAQLAGHPVIYDVLPQTGRFSKIVLSKPYVARWFDINELSESYIRELNKIEAHLNKLGKFTSADIERVKNTYTDILKGSDRYFEDADKPIVETVEKVMKELKKQLSDKMSYKNKQDDILKKVQAVIDDVNGKRPKTEDDVVNQALIVKALIKKGLWPAPGGAWCSSGMPVFDKMNKNKDYPIFKHYNYKGEDVTHFANLDCQTPYYFVHFENGKYNKKVIDFFTDYTKWLQEEYNFDGFRVDHIDHIVDEVSEKNGVPISYRIPRGVLGRMNLGIKKRIPYFATLAEYMLWDGYYKEYHKDMSFDVLWGDDIVSQSSKTPAQIIEDNGKLEKYNKKNGTLYPLSILKTYNNQDGEFEAINQYPGQLGEDGALFKWFKYKFLPGGNFANRPVLYVDGDESFTKTGIEYVIGHEVSMKRNRDWFFFEKFNAINYFVQNCPIIINGRSKLIIENEEGLAVWEINSKHGDLLVVANYLNPTEKVSEEDENGNCITKIKKGKILNDARIELKDRILNSYYEFDYDDMNKCVYAEKRLLNEIAGFITFEILKPGEFKVYSFDRRLS